MERIGGELPDAASAFERSEACRRGYGDDFDLRIFVVESNGILSEVAPFFVDRSVTLPRLRLLPRPASRTASSMATRPVNVSKGYRQSCLACHAPVEQTD